MAAATPIEAKVRYMHPKFDGSDEIPEIGSRETRRAATAAHIAMR